MSTWRDIIAQAFVDIGITQVGETITSAMEADAFIRLNQLRDSWSAEGATAFGQVVQSFSLQSGVGSYTLGTSGSLVTTARAQKIKSWNATYGVMRKGGDALSFADFDTAAQAKAQELAALNSQAAAEGVISGYPTSFTAPVPSVLGADTAYPNLNIRIYPPPNGTAGILELTYWIPIPVFALVTDTISLPPGYEEAFRFNLALALWPAYPTAPEIPAALAAQAQNSKAAIVQQNTPSTQPTVQQ